MFDADPVDAEPAHGRLPHVDMAVDQAGNDDAIRAVDDVDVGAGNDVCADFDNDVVFEQDASIFQDPVLPVHGDDGGVANERLCHVIVFLLNIIRADQARHAARRRAG
ncbi:hypothetical protein [Breoghania sp.]|uniref:hypothetical protein n=1 Tax=Breoghania sp. TaxID=2065378 RepID=UPI00262C0356|nr:hypothetical protein [Breoghania sp.]